jgi:hypothetical protein
MTEATRPALTKNETEKTTYAPDAIELQELGALPTVRALPQAAAFLTDLVQDRSFLESQVKSMVTCNSSFDTALAAYEGSSVGSLNRVASDDDSCLFPNDTGSRFTFDVESGTTYRIAVAGLEAEARGEGTFDLKVRYVGPSNDCSIHSQPISGGNATVNGTTLAATREAGEPDHYTTHPPNSDVWIGEHTVWYSWTAPFSRYAGACYPHGDRGFAQLGERASQARFGRTE